MASPDDEVRVLVVDSDLILAHSLAMALRTKGYVVRCAYSSETAPAVAKEFKPHAMIIEIVLPGVSGIALANHFAAIQPECRVLLTSGRESVIEVMEDPIPGDVPRFLPKPLDLFAVCEFLSACHSER